MFLDCLVKSSAHNEEAILVSLLLGGYGFFVRFRPGLGGRKFVRVNKAATAFFGLLGNHLELFFSMNPSSRA